MDRLLTLQALAEDLDALRAHSRTEHGMREAKRRQETTGMPPGVTLVRIPHVRPGEWWMTGPQATVVRELLEVAGTRTQDVPERVLLKSAGLPAGMKLRDLWRDTPAAGCWGTLVLPGKTAGTYRLASPPDGREDGSRPGDEVSYGPVEE